MAKKYYVVWLGTKTGVFDNWTDCLLATKGVTGALYKSFSSKEDAEEAYNSNNPWKYVGRKEAKTKKEIPANAEKPILNSLCVDAACSGNPGKLEYRGVRCEDGKELFHMGPFPEGTVNIGEFLAVVHGLALLKKHNVNVPIYSDSRTALAWVRDKRIRTNLPRNTVNAKLFDLVDRALLWLNNNTYTTPVLKWHTELWGEIPADFGRK